MPSVKITIWSRCHYVHLAARQRIGIGVLAWLVTASMAFGQCSVMWDQAPGTPGTGGGVSINALTVYDEGTGFNVLLAGGDFTNMGGVARNRIAKWNGSTWGSFGSGISGGTTPTVASMLVYGGLGNSFITGGRFTSAGGVAASNVAFWNGAAWSTFGSLSGGTLPVKTMALFNNQPYAGGDFTSPALRVATWNGSAWVALTGGGFSANSVNALATYDPPGAELEGLYAVGTFLTSGTPSASRIAKWNTVTWAALGTGLSNTARALVVFNTDLIVGGDFTTAGGVAANRVARWNGVTWSALGAGLAGTGTNGPSALAVFDDGTGSGSALYAAGNFTTAAGQTANSIAKWNGTTWSTLFTGITGPAIPTVAALQGIASGTASASLFAAGNTNFTTAGGIAANQIARWACLPCDPPTIGHPASQLNCEGQSVSFSVTAIGTAPILFQWRKDGINLANTGRISGVTTNTLTINPVFVSDASMNYDCVVRNPCVSVASNPAPLIVNSTPTASAGPDQYVCDAGYIQLAGAATNADSTFWTGGGGTYSPNASSPTSTYTPTAAERSAGSVTLTLTAVGMTPCPNASDAMTIFFNEDPNGPPATPTPIATPDCITSGNSATLSANVSGAVIDWYREVCGGIFVDTGSSIVVSPTSTTTYYAQARVGEPRGTGCLSGCASVTVQVGNCPIELTPTKDNTLIENATGSLSNGAGQYFFSGRTNQAAGIALRRAVLAFDVAGNVPPGATITSVSLTLNMNKSADSTNHTHTLHFLTADWGEGASTSGGNEGGGGASATGDATWLHRFFNSTFWTTPGGDFVASPSGSQGVAGFGNYTWASTPQMVADVQSWLDSPATNFGWLIRGNEAAARSAKRFAGRTYFDVASRPKLRISYQVGGAPPEITLQPQDQTVCEGDDVTFTVAADGDAPLSYQWRKDTMGLAGETADSLTIDPVTAADAGDYDVVVSNTAGSVSSDTATLTVLRLPTETDIHLPLVSTCEGDVVTYTVSVTGGTPPFEYQWRLDGADLPGETADALTIDPVTAGDAGEYDVVVSNICGTVTSATATLAVDVTPPTLVVPPDITAFADAGGCSTTFDTLPQATVLDDERASVAFSRSDGETNLLAAFGPDDDEIFITWTAQDDCGNTTTGIQTITIDPTNLLFVDIELSGILDDHSPNPGDTLSRCITFEAWDCPGGAPLATVEQTIAFPVDAGGRHVTNGVLLLLPCGPYSCLTAREPLHSLRSTAPDFSDDGASYSASFVGNRGTGGHWLLNGNLTPDEAIDVLDFASFVVRYSRNYGTGNTTCATPLYHADITGDGIVLAGDFTFININFLKFDEPNCCSPANADGTETSPTMSISVSDLWRRGMGELAGADLNGDGRVDLTDMQVFTGFAATVPDNRAAELPANSTGQPSAKRAGELARSATR